MAPVIVYKDKEMLFMTYTIIKQTKAAKNVTSNKCLGIPGMLCSFLNLPGPAGMFTSLIIQNSPNIHFYIGETSN